MERKYIAFISYRHLPLEMSIAKKLHRRIEHYRIPKDLRRDGADRLGYVFRDQEELPISSNLTANIEEALDHAEFLIVICSPETIKSRWVLGEIDYFLRDHPRDHVLAVLAAGTPETAFPPQLTRPAEEGGLPIEPLAANILTDSRIKRARLFQRESLRILAALIGCPFDALYQREVRYQRRRRSTALGVASVIAASFIGMLLNRNAQIRTQLERAQINESTALAALSESAYREGNYNGALQYALQALPSEAHPRPYVPAAELALAGELNIYRQGLLSYGCSFEQDSAIAFMALSHDGKYLATADSTGMIQMFDPESGGLLWRTQDARTIILTFAGEEYLVLSGPSGTEVRDVQDGSVRWRDDQLVFSNLLALSPDGQVILTSDYEESSQTQTEEISLRSVDSGELLQSLRLSAFEPHPCAAAAFDKNESCAAMLMDGGNGEASLLLCDFTSLSVRILRENLPCSAGSTAYRLVFTPDGSLALACDNMAGASFVMLFDAQENWELRFETKIETEKTAQVDIGIVLSLAALDFFDAGDEHLVVASKHELMMLSQDSGEIVWQRTLPGVLLAAKLYENESMGMILSDGTITACTPQGVLTYLQDIYSFSTRYTVFSAAIAGESYHGSCFVLVPADTPGRIGVLRFTDDPSMSLLAGLPDGIAKFVLLPSPSAELMACLLINPVDEIQSWILMNPANHTTSEPLPFPASLPQDLSLLSLLDSGELASINADAEDIPEGTDAISPPMILREDSDIRKILPLSNGQYFAAFSEDGRIRIAELNGPVLCDIPASRVGQRFSSESAIYHAAVNISGDRLLLFYDDILRPEPLCVVVDMTHWECVGIFEGPAAYLPADDSVLVFRQLTGLYISPFWSTDELIQKARMISGQENQR